MAQSAKFESLRSLAYTSISGSYAAVGTPLSYPARIICITNNTDKDMVFSTDASTDMLVVPAGSFKLFDFTTNRFNVDQYLVIAKGTQFYVKQVAAPGSGTVYIEAVYGA